MRIVQRDPAEPGLAEACFEIMRAVDQVDDPSGPRWSLRRLRGFLEHPDEPCELWAADDGTGAMPGWYYLILPDRENRDRAFVILTVHPAARRRATGPALLRHAAGRLAADGRVVLAGAARQGTPGA